MSFLSLFWKAWKDLWNYEISEEDQRELWRVELNMLYDRAAYLENKLNIKEKIPTKAEAQKELRIKRCTHTKGGRGVKGRPLVVKDYNLGYHRFIDGRIKIWCLNNCGFEAWEGDENWEKACKMWEQSTNTQSSSEIPDQNYYRFPNTTPSYDSEGSIKLEENENPIKGALKKEEYEEHLSQEIIVFIPDSEQK